MRWRATAGRRRCTFGAAAMARLVLLTCVWLLASSRAGAQPRPDVVGGGPPPSVREVTPRAASAPTLGYGALPGGLHVADARPAAAGQVGVMALAGFGYRDDLLAAGHRVRRGVGSLALSYAVHRTFALGLTFDGRYDRHSGLAPEGEDGYVGDPKLFARVGTRLGGLWVAGEAMLWIPGGDAPSLAFSATTVEPRLAATLELGKVALSANLGFRLDHSDASVEAPEKLSAQDQVSLGVSAYDAVTAGARAVASLGRAYFGAEASVEGYLGSDAPVATTRAGLVGGVLLTDAISLQGYLQLASAADPRAQLMSTGTVPLVPYEPLMTFGLALEARFGRTVAAPKAQAVAAGPDAEDEAPKRPAVAELAGVVVDDAGQPVAGATVAVAVGQDEVTVTTDGKGAFRVSALAPGTAKVIVQTPGKKPREATVELVGGDNRAPRLQLDPDLPPGELRGNVRARAGGRAIAGATVTVTPGGRTTTTGADGSFALEVPPGTYSVTTTAEGYAPQTIEAVIDQEGVTVKFINLDKTRRE